MSGLRISIDSNFEALGKAFEELGASQIISASRRAMNRTLLTLRKTSIGLITERIRIKPKELRSKYIWLERARGGNFLSLEAAIVFSGMSIPLLEFVRGSREPIQQKGIPVKRRKKTRAEITPGKRFVVKKGFVQRVQTLQVFKRRKSGEFYKQSVGSVAKLIIERGIGEELVRVGGEKLALELERELNFQILKMKELIPEKLD